MANINHFAYLSDLSDAKLHQLLNLADELKRSDYRSTEANGKILGLLFFNPSLRTKVSFETAAAHFGASTSSISPGQNSWSLETEIGVRMDGNKTEHIKEAIQVLSQYCDAIGVRAFSTFTNREKDYGEDVLNAILKYAEIPVINMESAMEHPCQALADWMTIRELFGRDSLAGKKLVLTWAPHPYPLPLAVPNSVLDMASRSGLDVVLACPGEIQPETTLLNKFNTQCQKNGSKFSVTSDQLAGMAGADVVYAKSWASPIIYNDPVEEARLRTEVYTDWTITSDKMSVTNNAYFMHCLPVRRNVVVNDEVLDGPGAVHIQQAGNRLHVQKAILKTLWNL